MRKLILAGLIAAACATPALAALTAGETAPDFTLKSAEGRNLRLAEQRGQKLFALGAYVGEVIRRNAAGWRWVPARGDPDNET